jgi:hypothetical protein
MDDLKVFFWKSILSKLELRKNNLDSFLITDNCTSRDYVSVCAPNELKKSEIKKLSHQRHSEIKIYVMNV